ncbi:carbohydrate-binding family 9-like protein [Muricauda sp. 2012CJ35-5]|uniref:Carbohydrate-binding family 9-like protein n=1 Tax=Flagellimonas spongiicola TaxID=2942208 RepID=A0ABT0PTI3_9FLAO|nr:carbohydrate-binding family 9-like protein [Allomuricauda spongiicola]MCL6274659.1 carbohydrate-binding family 9-like protein [Allomuricauda spongiicola]
MEQFFEKNRKAISFILFFLYLGCIALAAQETPRQYVAYRTTEKLNIDGKAAETAWQKAPWSDFFIDIEGNKKPTYNTRMKMLWDEENVYFFAQLEEPHVWGDITEHDAVIFHNNDFEIFLDPEADVHGYYELEWNILNTVWDQYLTAPYRMGNETVNGWEALGMKSAVAIQGTLNDPTDTDQGWSIEVEIPFKALRTGYYHNNIPKNTFWRVGFSRVNWDFEVTDGKYGRKKDDKGEYLHENNWVWSPQYVINMHEPERWGYVYFTENPVGGKADEFVIPQDEHIKWHLYERYREVIQQRDGKPAWESVSLDQFNGKSKQILGKTITPVLETYTKGFTIWVKSPFTGNILSVDKEGQFKTYEQ